MMLLVLNHENDSSFIYLSFSCFTLDLQNQLEHVNKTIHESEKEAKRLESEQSQLSAASTTNANDKQQQPAVAAPAFINGFTLEKLDNNDIRRFVSNFIMYHVTLLEILIEILFTE